MSRSIKNKLDQEFNKQLDIAKELIRRLPTTKEQLKALYWVKKAMQINAEVVIVKKNRNEFFAFFLNVVRDALFEAALRNCRGIYLSQKAKIKLKEEIRTLGTPGQQTYVLDQVMQKRGPNYMSRWSQDKRTYVAMQPIIGSGALVYMAVSNNGWIAGREQPADFIENYLNSTE